MKAGLKSLALTSHVGPGVVIRGSRLATAR